MSAKALPVVVKDFRLEKNGDVQRLSASVDGSSVWFQMSSDIPLAPRVEAFLGPAMFEAMVRNAPVIVEAGLPVSAKLLQGLSTIQSIFKCWNPDLHLVDIEAETAAPETRIDSAICCFSGGVDSSYTLATHDAEISHLLVVQGFDTWRSSIDWEDNVRARAEFASIANKKLIAVDSNVREFVEEREIYWGLVIGSILAGLGATLAPRLFLIPSSWTYQDLHAYGSHPLVDPLWSTEATCIVHHGADKRRSEKVERIAESQALLDQMQVCWKSCSRNCGECPKCVRTSLVLYLINKHSRNLPPYTSPHQLKALTPSGEGSLPFMEDLILACEQHGAQDIQRRLSLMRRRFLFKEAVRNIIKALTGHWGQRIYNKLGAAQEWRSLRATLRSRRSLY